MADFRIDVGFFSHVKTKRLRRRFGLEGVFALQMLWAYAALHEYDEFKIYTKEDIEIAIDWEGASDFVETIADIGFLDVADGGYRIHQWEIHNGYAATAARRSEAGRVAANMRWESKRKCGGNANAQKEQCDGNASALRNDAIGNAPSPVPSPSPEPDPEREEIAHASVDQIQAEEKKTPLPPGQALPEYSMEFLQIVEIFPRKEGIEDAWITFKGLKASHAYPGNPIVLPVLTQWAKSERWAEDNGKFVPSLKKWLQGKRWQDEAPKPRASTSPPPGQQVEAMAKSTAAVISKLSEAKRTATPMPKGMREKFIGGAG